jgi:hypothetical protein
MLEGVCDSFTMKIWLIFKRKIFPFLSTLQFEFLTKKKTVKIFIAIGIVDSKIAISMITILSVSCYFVLARQI